MIRWTSALKRKARLGRLELAPRCPAKRFDVARAAKDLGVLSDVRAERWRAGESAADDECRGLMRAVRESRERAEPLTDDVAIEGARGALLAPYDCEDTDLLSDRLVPWWVTAKGARFALQACVEVATFTRRWHTRAGQEAGWYLARDRSPRGPKMGPIAGFGALRAAFAEVPADDYRDALAWASKIRPSASLELRCALDYAFATEVDWARADASVIAQTAELPYFGITLLAATDIEVGLSIARSLPIAARYEAQFEELLFTLLDVHGDAAVLILSALYDRLRSAEPADVLKVTTLIESPSAANLVVETLTEASSRRLAKKYCLEHPVLALPALARIFAAPETAGRGAAAAIYAELCADRRPEVAQAMAALTPSEASTLRELGAEARRANADEEPERARLRAIWGRIAAWLDANHPRTSAVLAPGATIEDIARLESTFGREMPSAVRAFLREHDGEAEDPVGLLSGFVLVSTQEMGEEWGTMQDVARAATSVTTAPRGVQPLLWHQSWLPIASDGSGDCYFVDFAPAHDGIVGQVVSWSHEVGPSEIAAPGVVEWLDEFANRLERGDFGVWRDGTVSDEPDDS